MRPPLPLLWGLAATGAAAGVAALVARPGTTGGGALLGLALLVTAVALERGRRPRREGARERPRRASADELGQAGAAVARRPVLSGGMAALLALLGGTTLAGLARFGPRRRASTGWADGVRLVDGDGAPIRLASLEDNGIVVAWPETPGRHELGAAIVVRLPGAAGDAPRIGAYSRICTHAGCPVALFRPQDGVVYCPCHQATFDVTAAARPVFGPASRPLPRLPIGEDEDGFLVARGDFTSPPGPGAGTGSA